MKLLFALVTSRSKIPRQDPPFPDGKYPLDAAMKQALLLHLPHLSVENLNSYSFDQRSSNFPGASYDLFVFDDEGRPVVEGRQFYQGRMAFWPRLQSFQRIQTAKQSHGAANIRMSRRDR